MFWSQRTNTACVPLPPPFLPPEQEYLGSYVSDEAGRLVFREGLLVQVGRPARVVRAANCMSAACCMGSRLGV